MMIQPRKSYKLSLPDGRVIGLGERTIVMGIVNVTPDSFSDGGAYLDPAQALDAAVRLEAEGADIIDIGGESTRPGAVALSVTDEVARVLPALERIVGAVRVPVSVDTYKAEVARRALQVGAAIVNDISALSYDPNLADVIAESGAPVVLMHNRGRSNEMYGKAHYDDVGRGRCGGAESGDRSCLSSGHQAGPDCGRPWSWLCQEGGSHVLDAGGPGCA